MAGINAKDFLGKLSDGPAEEAGEGEMTGLRPGEMLLAAIDNRDPAAIEEAIRRCYEE